VLVRNLSQIKFVRYLGFAFSRYGKLMKDVPDEFHFLRGARSKKDAIRLQILALSGR
jgi:hypothetical protein